jgi:hypothetical protein
MPPGQIDTAGKVFLLILSGHRRACSPHVDTGTACHNSQQNTKRAQPDGTQLRL